MLKSGTLISDMLRHKGKKYYTQEIMCCDLVEVKRWRLTAIYECDKDQTGELCKVQHDPILPGARQVMMMMMIDTRTPDVAKRNDSPVLIKHKHVLREQVRAGNPVR